MNNRIRYKHLSLYVMLMITGIRFGYAQMQLVLTEPMQAQLNLNNLFMFQLITPEPSSVLWKGEVFNGSVLVASGESHVIELQQGPHQFTNQTGSFGFTYKNAGNSSANGDLPFGNYRICVKVSMVRNGIVEEVVEDCLTREYTPVSPPYLVAPSNGEEVITPNPLLVWSPPMPIISTLKPIYKIKLVEVLDNQSCYDALQRNYALLETDNLQQTQLVYPFNAVPLKDGGHYAWCISTRMGTYQFANTEVWCFYYRKENTETPPQNQEPYIVVKPGTNTGAYHTKDKKLYVQYNEMYNGKNFEYKLFDKANKDITGGCTILLEQQQGDNRVVFDFNQCASLKKGTYRLEITNSKNEQSILFFSYE